MSKIYEINVIQRDLENYEDWYFKEKSVDPTNVQTAFVTTSKREAESVFSEIIESEGMELISMGVRTLEDVLEITLFEIDLPDEITKEEIDDYGLEYVLENLPYDFGNYRKEPAIKEITLTRHGADETIREMEKDYKNLWDRINS